MKCLALVVSVAALVVGVASEATVTSRTPYWLGDAGGVVLYIYGAGKRSLIKFSLKTLHFLFYSNFSFYTVE
ncbi:hypothetical protein E2C01_069193 [Portunus trituberculatus]|uniref:Uncharacterized protein n=1 Tax=Portunus trituberculatus TaxID=210409 RepID=A0A5B7HZY7_PORTR|nr:hypothetical protein [Portunus trituberculatus]